jgi:RIO kinase 1
MIKGGKEASVYLCRGNQTTGKEWLAAKVYRPRMYRNLKDDHIYREGRTQLDESGLELHDERADRAMAKRTKYGLNLMHVDWIQHEFETMRVLHEKGGALPKPYICANNAILMDYIGAPDHPAPPLVSIDLDAALAGRLFEKVLSNIELMLSLNLVHGDLSAYNLLYWQEDIWLIDFPQAFDPRRNRNAWTIFYRDMIRLCQYFEKQGVPADARQIAETRWKRAGLDAPRLEDILALERSLEDV